MPVPTVYRITFRHQPGIVIMCKSAPLGTLLKLANMGINNKDEKETLKAFGYFAKRILDWNIDHPEIEQEFEDEELSDACPQCGLFAGDRLPITAKGLSCLGVDFVQLVIAAWITKVSRVSLPKDESLSDGESSTEMPINELGSLQSPISSEMLSLSADS
jgi:hypothetical protein